jgi:methyl-accepting chemotaxis protein
VGQIEGVTQQNAAMAEEASAAANAAAEQAGAPRRAVSIFKLDDGAIGV